MKQQLKQTAIRLGIMRLYRAVKVVLLMLKPSNLLSNITYRMRGSRDGFPIPPLRLIYLTINNPSIFDYFRGGFVTHRSIIRLLTRNGIDQNDFTSILEFGCGCARVLREFSSLPKAELFGSDYNPALIRWCRTHMYCANFSVNALEPPLAFPDASFDFLYLISVFTHLPERTQSHWLQELYRVMKQNGYAIISLHGEHFVRTHLTEEEQSVFLKKGYAERDLDPAGSNHYGTYHTRQYFESMLEGMFRILDVAPGGAPNSPYQDLYLLQKTGE